MINTTFTNTDLETLLTQSQQDSLWLTEQEFNRTMQDNLLRQEIFNAIDRLETSKIQFIDNQFKRILSRYR